MLIISTTKQVRLLHSVPGLLVKKDAHPSNPVFAGVVAIFDL